jgi:protein-S-isoprenylcysteine O-methyltransferase Ste14
MISGVVAMLFGQALFWGSWAIGIWAALVLLINHVYFVLIEEPGLEERFGASYINYKARVPRWIPRW